tara:strand:- start:194 stop:337 length:144 start_codon:yes stop_codon:yes gene_type:complete
MTIIASRVQYKQKKLFFRVCYAFLDRDSVFVEKAIKEKTPYDKDKET